MNFAFCLHFTVLGDSNGVISMLRRRCNDDKISVRKSALVAIEMMVRIEGCDFNGLVNQFCFGV